MMLLPVFLLLLAPLTLALAVARGETRSNTYLLSNVTIFDPPKDYTVPRTLYARTLLLNQAGESNNVLLATWENYLP